MSRFGTARLLAAAAGVASVALVVPAAHAAPVQQQTSHPAQISASVARHESHSLHGAHHARTHADLSSGNWSGYVGQGSSGSQTSVSSSWVQPSVQCGSQNTYSSFWVGLDGASNSALEQTGTEADCINGQAYYGAWWEVLPAAESPYSVSVSPGDHMSASVTDNGDGTFTMTLTDSTRGWTKTTRHSGSSGYQDSSAEVIAEATSVNGQIAQLSDFGSVRFTGSRANGSLLDNDAPQSIDMRNQSSGDVMAEPGSLSGGAFTDTWENFS